ncbi:MAG TPA: ribonuclease III [Terriglobia bacterium]|nr:ribonuclease III [Terriglobia bacterium]
MARPSFNRLEKRIGYKFRDRDLLVEALTHSSYAQEVSRPTRYNELMEFLGDAVLSFAVTLRLLEAFPEYDEGKLSLARSSLVAANYLSGIALELGLGEYLRLGQSEERSGGRRKSGILVDALEALLAAVYRDGGFEEARRVIERVVLPADLVARVDDLFANNYKGALQERLQAERQGPARYSVVEEEGLEHQKTFTVEVKTGAGVVARGSGASKKAAQQQAARRALAMLTEKVEADG